MNSVTVQTFKQALAQFERSGNLDELIDLFHPQGKLCNMSTHREFAGTDGAREFWRNHIEPFDGIKTRFTDAMELGTKIVLEWESEGHRKNGTPVKVQGISVFEKGPQGIFNFRTYYDASSLIEAPERAEPPPSSGDKKTWSA